MSADPMLETAVPILSDADLAVFRERAAGYDARNAFFSEDWSVLERSGYLIQNVPAEFGGLGLGLAETVRNQRRLGAYAPADALAVNMHLYWTGVAADL